MQSFKAFPQAASASLGTPQLQTLMFQQPFHSITASGEEPPPVSPAECSSVQRESSGLGLEGLGSATNFAGLELSVGKVGAPCLPSAHPAYHHVPQMPSGLCL